MSLPARSASFNAAVMVEGHPHWTYNGLYKHDSNHEGWPVLKKVQHGRAADRYMYRSARSDNWCLDRDPNPEGGPCNVSEGGMGGYIAAPGGMLPVGARTWQVPNPEWFSTNCKLNWQHRTLTVTLQQR